MKIKNTIMPLALLAIISNQTITYANTPSPEAGKIPVHLVNNSGKTLHVCLYKDPVNPNINTLIKLGDSTLNTKELGTNNSNKEFDFNIVQDDVKGGARFLFSEQDCTANYPDLATADYLYDMVEIGGENAVWNTSSVDFFGLPIQLQEGTDKVGYTDSTTRQAIINDLKSTYDKQEDTLYGDKFFKKDSANTNIVRVFSPQHFYTDAKDIWSDTINKGLQQLSLYQGDVKYGENVYNHFIQLSPNSLQVNMNGLPITITDINTANAISGEIKWSGGDGGQFAGLLSAAINRGVLDNPAHWGKNDSANTGSPEYYYKRSDKQYNLYAKVLSDYAINNRLYATSYNDFYHMDSSLTPTPNKGTVTINILPLS